MSGAQRQADAHFMTLALAEAVKGLGRTHPNPAVGAVIVKAGRVIATGYHQRAGLPHAEAMALAAAGARAKGATIYTTMEPCDHHGRTPPCTEAILRAGLTRVVFGSSDPNPLVNGKGVRRLKKSGVEVRPHVLRDQADALNRPFFKAMTLGLPWVTLKAGMTLDGKIATASGASKWITSEASRAEAHRLRDRADAVLVGAGTVEADDPLLTARFKGARSPVRVVVDSRLRTAPSAQIYRVGKRLRTIVATTVKADAPKARALARRGVEVRTVRSLRGHVDLAELLRSLAADGLLHVLAEGGAQLHGALLRAQLADEVVLFVAPKLFGHGGLTWSGELGVGTPQQAVLLTGLTARQLGDDVVLNGLLVPPGRR